MDPLEQRINDSLHYLDDFILVAGGGVPSNGTVSSTFSEQRVPLEQSKLEGLLQNLTFLGIKVDIVSLQLRLLRDKILRLKEMLYHSR